MNFLKTIFWNKDEKRIRTFFRILILILMAAILANIISFAVEGISEFAEKTMLNFLIMFAILLPIFIVGKYIDQRQWADFGITLLPFRQFLYGALLGALLVSIIFAIQYFMGWLSLEQVQLNQFPTYAFALVLLGQAFRYLCGSIFEEAFSRGYLLLNIAEGLRGRLNTTQAVMISYLLTSSIFGLLHLFNENASFLSSINLILLGLLFGWMVLKTGKLHFAIGLHAFWNIFQNNVFGFANSGKSSVASIYSFENAGNPLWTGGEFGIEGGLICTITVLGALIILSYREILGKRKLDQQVLR